MRRVAGGQHVQGLGDDGALDAPTGDRPDDLAVLADGHGGARLPRAGSLDVDHSSERHALALLAPAIEITQEILHSITS